MSEYMVPLTVRCEGTKVSMTNLRTLEREEFIGKVHQLWGLAVPYAVIEGPHGFHVIELVWLGPVPPPNDEDYSYDVVFEEHSTYFKRVSGHDPETGQGHQEPYEDLSLALLCYEGLKKQHEEWQASLPRTTYEQRIDAMLSEETAVAREDILDVRGTATTNSTVWEERKDRKLSPAKEEENEHE